METINWIIEKWDEVNPYKETPWMWIFLIVVLVAKRIYQVSRSTVPYGGIGLLVNKVNTKKEEEEKEKKDEKKEEEGEKKEGEQEEDSKDKRWRVEKITDDSPAKGKVQIGDIILAVDGKNVEAEASLMTFLRGKVGSEVAIQLERTAADGTVTQVDVKVTRAVIRQPKATQKVDNKKKD